MANQVSEVKMTQTQVDKILGQKWMSVKNASLIFGIPTYQLKQKAQLYLLTVKAFGESSPDVKGLKSIRTETGAIMLHTESMQAAAAARATGTHTNDGRQRMLIRLNAAEVEHLKADPGLSQAVKNSLTKAYKYNAKKTKLVLTAEGEGDDDDTEGVYSDDEDEDEEVEA